MCPSSQEENAVDPAELCATFDTSSWGNFLEDVQKDLKAVVRDYPRMVVCVNTGLRHNYECMGETKHSKGENERQMFVARLNRVKETTILIAELCGEADTYGKAFQQAWEAYIEHHDRADTSVPVDVHVLLEHALKTSKMMPQDGEPLAANLSHNASKTFLILLLTVQSIMVNPSQTIKNYFAMPWVGHMQDAGWTIHIYPQAFETHPLKENAPKPSTSILVENRQICRHYVLESQQRSIPRFELQYSFVMTVDFEKGDKVREGCLEKYVESSKLELTNARLQVPSCSCFLHDWRTRARELKKKVKEIGADFSTCGAL